MIKFIAHEVYPDDQYVKESCTLAVDEAQRFTYVRKMKKDGGLFWSPISTSVNFRSEKKFLHSIEWDSNFLAKDIIAFLEARSWENASAHRSKVEMIEPARALAPAQQKYEQTSFIDECPF